MSSCDGWLAALVPREVSARVPLARALQNRSRAPARARRARVRAVSRLLAHVACVFGRVCAAELRKQGPFAMPDPAPPPPSLVATCSAACSRGGRSHGAVSRRRSLASAAPQPWRLAPPLNEGPPRWPLRDHPVRALKRQPVAARGGERVTRAPPAAPRVCSLAPRRGQQQRSPPSYASQRRRWRWRAQTRVSPRRRRKRAPPRRRRRRKRAPSRPRRRHAPSRPRRRQR